MEKVVVTGVGGPAGRAVAAYFRQCSYTVVGTDVAAVKSDVDTFIRVPPGDAPEFSPAIFHILESEKPRLFIPTVTEELVPAARMRNAVRDLGIRMFMSDVRAVCIADDKYLTAKALAAHGVEVPRSLSDEDVENPFVAGDALGYPFVAKPRHGRGGRGVFVYRDRSEAVIESRTGVVFQEFLPGEEYDANLFAGPDGEPVVTRVLLKTALKNGIVGNAVSVTAVDQPDIARLAVRAAAALKFEGPIDIDIRRGADGIPRVLEINARVGANVLCAGGILETMLHESCKGQS